MLILDNARIHWNSELIEMCEDADVTLARLPPYSPDFNPIETSFALLKAWIRRHGELVASYAECGEFGKFLKDAIREQKEVEAPKNLFRLAGIDYL